MKRSCLIVTAAVLGLFVLSISTLAAKNISVPPEGELRRLVSRTMMDLHVAIQQKKVATLYEKLSKQTKATTSIEQISGALQDFIDRQIDLAGLIKDAAPIYDKPPIINTNGILVLAGHYPVKGWQVSFDFGYVWEDSGWKPLGFGLEVNPSAGADPQQVSAANELRKLTDKTLLDLNAAIQAKNFAEFYKTIAALWKDQITANEFGSIFQGFVDKHINLGDIKDVAPVYEGQPKVDENGVLLVSGHYPAKLQRVIFRLKYINEDAAWKLIGIKVNTELNVTKTSIPPENELRKLADQTLLDFNAAIQAKDFTGFYKTIASLWKQQITATELGSAFQEFIEEHVNLASIKDVAPVYDERPKVDENGILMLTGHYPTEPKQVIFRLGYVAEDSVWKLFSIKVNLRSDPSKTVVPSESTLRKLTDQTMLDFNAAIQAKDFAAFYKTISATWKDQITAKELGNVFQGFIDNHIDLGNIKDVAPVYDAPPKINEDEVLVLSGHYPTEPLQVIFRLKFVNEDSVWKLIGINVSYKQK